MTAPADMSGRRIGMLTVLCRSGSIGGKAAWLCRCECGNEKRMRGNLLRSGKAKACGCLKGLNHGPITHGHASHSRTNATYKTWIQMRARCSSPTHHNFPNYGGRGIRVCQRWESFEQFLADMGERPAGTTIDRINNDGNYEPGNCRWATRAEQNRNRSDTRRITIGGRTHSAAEWARENGISTGAVYQRIRLGWTEFEAVTVPMRKSARPA